MPNRCAKPTASFQYRCLRFGLRSLLIVMLVLSSFFGWVGFEIRRGREIEQAIEGMRLQRISYRSQIPSWLKKHLGQYFLATVVFEHGYANDDAALAHAGRLRVKELYLDGARITNSGLERLQGTPDLKILTLSQTKATDEGLQSLHGMNSLQYLYLKRSAITAAGVREFRQAAPNCQVVVDNKPAM